MFAPLKKHLVLSAIALVAAILPVRPAYSGGVGITIFESSPGDTPSVHIENIPFNRQRVPAPLSLKAYRDLEFHWSSTYSGAPFNIPNGTVHNELFRLGLVACQVPSNPFGFEDRTDIQLVVDFLQVNVPGRPREPYSPDPTTYGFHVRANYDPLNREHIDAYIARPQTSAASNAHNFDPVFGTQNGDCNACPSKFPSYYKWEDEDVDTGIPANINNVLYLNSLSINGPIPGRIDVIDSLLWSRPDAGVNGVFMHEFQHVLNGVELGGSAMEEMFSSAAEALVGGADERLIYDVPYTWSLLSGDPLNYAAWRLFTAYLAYNFLGPPRVSRTISWLVGPTAPSLASLATRGSRCWVDSLRIRRAWVVSRVVLKKEVA